MNVNFEPIIRGLKSGIFDWDETDFTLGLCRSQLQKKKSGVKKCLEIMTIKGGGEGGPTPNGENHPKFPFWLFDYPPKKPFFIYTGK